MPSRKIRGRRARKLNRSAPVRESYDRVLMVCEGSKTEPLYLREVVDDLELSSANISITGDGGSSPKSVVQYAQELYQQDSSLGGKYDRVYCVFDRDSHSSYAEALQSIRNARPRNVFHAATSVPCFEYWILLHFQYTTQAFARTGSRSPCDQVINLLNSHLPEYAKGDGRLYESIKGQTETAIERAVRANADATSAGTDNPTTGVGDLLDYLRAIKSC